MSVSSESPSARGRCNCGGVSYAVRGPLRPVVACHCNECRRFSGSFWHATAARRTDLAIEDDGSLRWHMFTERTRRGFCARCGASMFFDPMERDYVAIGAGTLEKPTGLELSVHIWTPEAGDYYRIADGVREIADSNHGLRFPDEAP